MEAPVAVDVREFAGIRIPSRLNDRLDRISKAMRVRWPAAMRRGLKICAPALLDVTPLDERTVALAFAAAAELAEDRAFTRSEDWDVRAAEEPAAEAAEPAPPKRARKPKPATPAEAPAEEPAAEDAGGLGGGRGGYNVKIQSFVAAEQAEALRNWGRVAVGEAATMSEILRGVCDYFRIGGGK